MSNTRDNGPELDFYELRRRHEEYKSRVRASKTINDTPVAERLERKQNKSQALREESAPIAPDAESPVEIHDAADEPELEVEEQDPLARLVEMDEEGEDLDNFEEDDRDAENPNPFDSFIRLFHGIKSNIAARREAREAAEMEALDDDLSEEELAALEMEEADDWEMADPVSTQKVASGNTGSTPEQGEEILDIEDAPEPVSRRSSRRNKADLQSEEDYAEDTDSYLEDDDESAYLEDDEMDDRGSGFKRFLNLFVTRVDEDEEEDEEDEEDEEVPINEPKPSKEVRSKKSSDDEFFEKFIHSVYSDTEGGHDMDEMNKSATDPIQKMAEGLETSGMSRRERRERAQRLAAQEAERKAEEARKAASVKPLFEVEPSLNTTEVEPSVDLPVIEITQKPEAEKLAVDMPIEIEESVDEPTREFTPVNMREVQGSVTKDDPFAIPEDQSFTHSKADDEDDDEDEDDEDEDVKKKPRRGLFGRRAAKYDEDDDDDEDYDEDEDDDDDEDEDEEEDRHSRSRGLFGRRKKSSDEDDDDDDEDDEEYDEYEDDDEYDDEDDEYDDYDDEDEYDDRYPISHHIFGVLKWVALLLVLLVLIVLGLNFLYASGSNFLVPQLHEAMGDTAAFHLLFPKYEERTTLPETTVVPELTAAPEVQVQETAEPQTTMSIPNLDNNGSITETPVINVAPVDGSTNSGDASSAGAIG